tara:strand:- start:482 stop:1279 length:798 start_codon:yes stop_codon:yes gene_type:complete
VKFSIVANPKQQKMKKILTKVIGFLEDFDLEEETAKIVGLQGNPIDKLKGEIVISLGGDGTLLYILDNLNKPVFGINCGGVGFLTEIEHSDDLFNAFKKLEKNNYELQKLNRIDAFLNDLNVGTALNEVVLHSSRVAKIQGFEIEIDGSIADSFRGDGLIIATPTGSTSYAMSVGSPILYPTMESHIVVPMAAYRIGARPLVVPSKYTINTRITGHPEAVMVIDGKDEIMIKKEDKLHFKKSKDPVELIRFKDNFFDKVRSKLRL